MSVTVIGAEKLVHTFERLAQVDMEKVMRGIARDVYNRGKNEGGTPVRTGELRQSLSVTKKDTGYEVGYTKEYAPYVEYGHRTRNGGYVQGQRYLARNVETQMPKLQGALADAIRQAGGKDIV